MGIKDVIDNLPMDRDLKRELRRVSSFAQNSSAEYFESLKEQGIEDPRFHSGRGEKSLLKVTYTQLMDLFGVSRRTIYYWIKSGRLVLTLKGIVDLYNSQT